MANFDGDNGNNTLNGTQAADRLRGFGGNDWLYGYGGNDRLEGGNGLDRLYGGTGRDILIGGLGRDVMYGGGGNDTFAFDDRDAGDVSAGPASDVIRDFSAGDVLDIIAVDILNLDYYGRNPERGAASIWQVNGSTYVSWNTFGTIHDVELRGFNDDPYDQIRWYQDDFTADTATTGRVAVGRAATGTIEVDQDADWFRTTIERGHTYVFDVRGAPDVQGTLAGAFLQIFDGNGNVQRAGHEQTGFSASTTGSYYAEVMPEQGQALGTYSLTMREIVDVSDFIGTTGRIAVGQTINGEVQFQDDQDWFRVRLVEGQSYSINLNGGQSGLGTLFDPYLDLRDKNGTYFIGNDDWLDRDSRIDFTAEETGNYYINAAAEEIDDLGTYRLSVSRIDDLAV